MLRSGPCSQGVELAAVETGLSSGTPSTHRPAALQGPALGSHPPAWTWVLQAAWFSLPSPLFLTPTLQVALPSLASHSARGLAWPGRPSPSGQALHIGGRTEAWLSALCSDPCTSGRARAPRAYALGRWGSSHTSPSCARWGAHQGVGRLRRLGDISVAQVTEPCDQEAHGEQEGPGEGVGPCPVCVSKETRTGRVRP